MATNPKWHQPLSAWRRYFRQWILEPQPKALMDALDAFGPREVITWAEGLEQEVFTGSTGRVFPKTMKASPLLRAWLARLNSHGVAIRTRWRWQGHDGMTSQFLTPEGEVDFASDAIVLATGFSLFNPQNKPYGYGVFKNVVTNMELEDILRREGEA